MWGCNYDMKKMLKGVWVGGGGAVEGKISLLINR